MPIADRPRKPKLPTKKPPQPITDGPDGGGGSGSDKPPSGGGDSSSDGSGGSEGERKKKERKKVKEAKKKWALDSSDTDGPGSEIHRQNVRLAAPCVLCAPRARVVCRGQPVYNFGGAFPQTQRGRRFRRWQEGPYWWRRAKRSSCSSAHAAPDQDAKP